MDRNIIVTTDSQKMAKINKKDLEHLTDQEIWNWMHQEDWVLSPEPIISYISEGNDEYDYSLGGRLNRVEKLLMLIVNERFMANSFQESTMMGLKC